MSQSDQTSEEEIREPNAADFSSERDVLIQRGSQDQDKANHTDKTTHTIYVYLLSIFAALGGFLFGYDTGVVSGAMLLLAKEFSLSDMWKEFVVSITIGTAILGTVVGGVLNDKCGRRPVLLICSAVFTAGAVVMGISRTKEILLLGRGIVGFGIGGASMTVPMYIAESTPTSIRGQLITMNNLFITGGQFIASVIDGLFSNHPEGWRYMLGLAGIPSIIMFFGCIVLPESPRWLVKKKRIDKARKVLMKLSGTSSVEEEMQSVLMICQEEEQEEKEQGNSICMRMLTDPNTRRALLVGCMLQAIQQLSGINTVMYYSATIIFMSGIGKEGMAIWLAAAVAFGNFLFTIVGLLLVERVGRRKLLLSSLAGVIVSLFLIGGAFHLAEIKDTPVTFSEAGPALSSECLSTRDCMDCIVKKDCGFCYEKDTASGNFINGSCVFSNASNHRPFYGRCSHKPSGALWRFDSCPSKYSWLAVLGLILYIATFAPGIGAMPWTLNSEIFPLWARSTGNSCTTAVNWICNLLIAITFLDLMKLVTRPGAFWLYGSIALAGWIFFYFFVPETKGKSLEELQNIMIASKK